MILIFRDPVDGDDKTFEGYSTEPGTVCVAVYDGLPTIEEVDVLGENEEIESHIALKLGDWATLLSAVNKEDSL